MVPLILENLGRIYEVYVDENNNSSYDEGELNTLTDTGKMSF